MQLDAKEFPCLTYTRDLKDWHDFIRRSPKEYKNLIDGVKKECEIIEFRMPPEICNKGKKVFVDTNISIETSGFIALGISFDSSNISSNNESSISLFEKFFKI